MNEYEEYAKKKFELHGFDVIQIGKPDLIVMKDGKISFVDLKREHDKVSKHQNDAMCKLTKHGFDCFVYHPENFKKNFYATFLGEDILE